MNRITSTATLLGATTLLVGLFGCADAPEANEIAEAPVAAAPAEAPVAAQGGAEAPVDAALLDPNVATREDLLAVPGLDQAAADAIITGRPYDDMLAVDRALAPQLSEQEREVVYRKVWKPLDLNTATSEEILLIPGVGERMQHEFEEYRPYRGIEQFRREIGKYVDDAEVSRLERYVVVR
jgi:DNA uptake protein ComE-like DNA-binding protein